MTDTYSASHLGTAKATSYDNDFTTGFLGQFWAEVEKPHLYDLLDELFADELSGQQHLDVACGSGRILEALDGRVGHSSGVDISPDMLAVAQQKVPRATIRKADISDFGEHEKYDLITAFRFFLNAEPWLRRSALESIYTALRPGGVLVANIHASPWSVVGAVRRTRRRLGLKADNTMHHTEFVELLTNAGLEPVASRTYGFVPVASSIDHHLVRSVLCRGDRLATRYLPDQSRFASTLLVAAQKPG